MKKNKAVATLSTQDQQSIEEACQWAIMHGVAFKQADMSARHCPFSLAPIAIEKQTYQRLLAITPLITKLIANVAEDHDFLRTSLKKMANADPFFKRLMALHQQIHGDDNAALAPARQPLLLMRTDYMDDRHHGAKVIEFNGIAAGMGPFGQRASELHAFIRHQAPKLYHQWAEQHLATPIDNQGLEQLAYAIKVAATKIKQGAKEIGQPLFVMVVQKSEDNVYDQHLLEIALQKLGLRTVRRTFEQLSAELSTGKNNRLILKDMGAVDLLYLRTGYQFIDYCDNSKEEEECCYTLSQMRVFIEQHAVAINATVSQQLATSKSMQMKLTSMPAKDYQRWGIPLSEAKLIKSVLAQMKQVNAETIDWFHSTANKKQWVLKNQGEGGGHCIFGDDISAQLSKLAPKEYDAWALMQRLYPHERDKPTLAIREGRATLVDDLVSEIGLFSAYFNGEPVTEHQGYAGYLIRSKPAGENEGGIHSGMGILDSLTLIDPQ